MTRAGGKSPLLSVQQLQNLGYNIVIYPVTALRLAMKAVEDGLKALHDQGSQQTLTASDLEPAWRGHQPHRN